MALDILNQMGLGSIMSWLSSIIFWLLFALVFFGIGILFLWRRKRKRFNIPVIEITLLGNGKAGFKNLKAGWFKSQSILFGLIEMGGERRLLVKDGREIYNPSSEDFQTINDNNGMVVQRKGDDPKILVPINRILLDRESQEMLNAIAPADFRDVASRIIRETEKETMSKFNRFMEQAMPILQIVGFVLSLIFVIQYVKHSQTEAWLNTQQAIKLAYENKGAVIPSVTAPFVLFFKRKWFK